MRTTDVSLVVSAVNELANEQFLCFVGLGEEREILNRCATHLKPPSKDMVTKKLASIQYMIS